MADFCKQCSEEMFNQDYGDLAGLGDGRELKPGYGWQALCEGCGPTYVDDSGRCINPHCIKGHGKDGDQKAT